MTGPVRTFKLKPPPVKLPAGFKDALNEQQVAAVAHEKGPALVIAGAGSGKTRVLTYRVAWLLHRGVDPSKIMLVTFTKKAAEEMLSRVKVLVPASVDSLVAGTFHHVANTFLRRHARVIGHDPGFTIMDRDDSVQLFKLVRAAFMGRLPRGKHPRHPSASTLATIRSKVANLQATVEEIVERDHPQFTGVAGAVGAMMDEYDRRKKGMNLMDFDDLLVYFLRLLRNKNAGEKIARSITHVLVDEFQDVNQIQADIVKEIGTRATSVMVVGDDAQAIFGFRGSDIRHFMEFGSWFPAPAARYLLTTNYRSTPQVLAVANASIKHNAKQYRKELVPVAGPGEKPALVPCNTRDEECHFVCQHLLRERDEGIPFHEQSVLFRAAAHSIALQKWLLHYNIPFVVRAGPAFYEKAHVKDLLAHCLVVANPHHEIAWSRVLERVPSLGERSAQVIAKELAGEGSPLAAFLNGDWMDLPGTRVKQGAKAGIEALKSVLGGFCSPGGAPLPGERLPPPASIMETFLAYYAPVLKEVHARPEERLEELKELVHFCAQYDDLEEMLAELAISDTWAGKSGGAPQWDEPPVVLSTIHQAKGLEWTNVHVIGARDGLFPNLDMVGDEIEEERRLFYVACTRAKKTLLFSFPIEAPWQEGTRLLGRKSLFLEEIEGDEVFDVMLLEQE